MSIAGMAGEDAVWHVLHMRNKDCSRQQLRETCTDDWSADTIRRHLNAWGERSLISLLPDGGLEHLDLPALAELKNGRWLLVLQRRRRRYIVEQGSGRLALDPTHLRNEMSGLTLDLRPELPGVFSIWRLLGSSVLRHRRVLIQLAGASLLLQLLVLASPQLTRIVLDRAFPAAALSLLQLVVLGTVLSAIFQAWVGWIRAAAILYIRTRLEAAVERDLLDHILALPFAFLDGMSIGQRLQGFYAGGDARDFFVDRLVGTVLDGVMATLYILVMAYTMPMPTIAVVLAACALCSIVGAASLPQARIQREEVDASVRQRGFLAEVLWGMAAVKAVAWEGGAWRRWMAQFETELTLGLRRRRLALWSELGIEAGRQGLAVMVLVWGGKLVLDGKITTGSLLAFAQMSSGFFGSALGLAMTYVSFTLLRPQISRLGEFLHVPRRTRRHRPGMTSSEAGPLVLEDVWFRHQESTPWILQGFSMRVEAGEKLWIRAPSGGGKTTLLRLIAGLYGPERGKVRIAGRDAQAARQQMFYLPQLMDFYEGSILQNLRILSAGASRERIIEAARISGLDAFASTLPMGYDTRLAQRGATLSGGQRQLIALTAVIASGRSLIILDEAFANVDHISRLSFVQSGWFAHKTVIYANHDGALQPPGESWRELHLRPS